MLSCGLPRRMRIGMIGPQDSDVDLLDSIDQRSGAGCAGEPSRKWWLVERDPLSAY